MNRPIGTVLILLAVAVTLPTVADFAQAITPVLVALLLCLVVAQWLS